MKATEPSLVELTTWIVSSFVAHNAVRIDELGQLISATYSALAQIAESTEANPHDSPQSPAVARDESVNADYLVCLEDGRRFKALKRHLLLCHSLTPEQYRTRWGLAADYPMVAPCYALLRSELARRRGR